MNSNLVQDKAQVPTHFNRAARAYDVLCTLNPGYKRHLRLSAKRMNLDPRSRILDLCCGTGLSTEALVAEYPEAAIMGMDASEGMLALAKKKSVLGEIPFLLGDAMEPQEALENVLGEVATFDAVFMAYGIRNMVDPDTCLQRIFELLRPGGTVCFHEYSVADSKRAKTVWGAVSRTIIMPLGTIGTGTPELFRYLHQSVVNFDGTTAFLRRLAQHGFVEGQVQTMDGWQRGIVHTFLARKPE